MSLDYKEWKEFALQNYELVRKYKDRVVYEADIDGKEIHMTLAEVFEVCDGSIYEDLFRRAIMKSVYTNAKPNKAVSRVMNLHFGISE